MSTADPTPECIADYRRALFSRMSLRSWIDLIPASPPAVKMLLALLVLDLVFIGVFVFYGVQQVISDNPAKFPQMWSLAADYSIPEFFGYAKLALSAVFLFAAFRMTNHLIWWSWSIIFALLMADDMLQLHEYGGEWIAGFMPFKSIVGIEAHHIGELTLYALLAAIALVVLIKGVLRTPAVTVAKSGFFLIVVMGLVVCGVGIDLISSASYFQDTDAGTAVSKTLYGVLIIAEDGGESIFMTLGCAGAFAVWLKFRDQYAQDASRQLVSTRQTSQHAYNLHNDGHRNNQNTDWE